VSPDTATTSALIGAIVGTTPDEEAAAWMAPPTLLAPVDRIRFFCARSDVNDASDEALLFITISRFAFSTRNSASAIARSMSSMLSGSCENREPAIDADGPISECIVNSSTTLAGWLMAFELLCTTIASATAEPSLMTIASATAEPSLTLTCEDEDIVSGIATLAPSCGNWNVLSIAHLSNLSKDSSFRFDSSAMSCSLISGAAAAGGDAMARRGACVSSTADNL
jgi:hypothetical protein